MVSFLKWQPLCVLPCCSWAWQASGRVSAGQAPSCGGAKPATSAVGAAAAGAWQQGCGERCCWAGTAQGQWPGAMALAEIGACCLELSGTKE